MGKVVFEDPVHHISGKISKKYRTCYNYRRWSERKYTSVHGDRTTPASTEELKVRARFKVVRQAALERSMDLMHLTYDQMDFIEEKKDAPREQRDAPGICFSLPCDFIIKLGGLVVWTVNNHIYPVQATLVSLSPPVCPIHRSLAVSILVV